jgi:signal peptidase II
VTHRSLGLLIGAAVAVLDVVTKVWAVAVFADEPRVLLGDGFLRLSVTRNPGASFSSFQNGGVAIGVIAIGVAGLVVYMLGRVAHRAEAIGLGAVLGGAVGNLLDRIARGDGFLDGAVVDWIDFSFFPSFNVADSAITIGAAVLILTSFLVRTHADE